MKHGSKGSFLIGLLILIFGLILLINKLNFILFPDWVFSWETILIVLGLALGARKRFKIGIWIVIVFIGAFFLLEDITDLSLQKYGLALGIIILGLIVILQSLRGSSSFHSSIPWRQSKSEDPSSDSKIDVGLFFGGTKQTLSSKTFKGGRVSCVFGGADIDLSQIDTDQQGPVIIDLVVLFGGIKLMVPTNWSLTSEVNAILGSVNDKRRFSTTDVESGNKQLVLTGTVVFGGVEVTN